jgi:hypothetical protein
MDVPYFGVAFASDQMTKVSSREGSVLHLNSQG